MTMRPADREEQLAQAEALLSDQPHRGSFAKGLLFGQYPADLLPEYPWPFRDATGDALVEKLTAFCQQQIDPVAIDQKAEIPQAVISGLGRLGVLGACLPKSCGGLGLSQTGYCRLLEVLGGHCASTALFVNAHHSIGPRAIVLFGTPEQKSRWLPKLASGEWLSAFALTEPEAGSDAANVQTTAIPTPDGRGFVLNGEKRWITNGGIAQVLTVMARTPAEEGAARGQTNVSAFIVSPEMAGFKVVEQRMSKCGVRGTATSRLAFQNMFVPAENLLGQRGKGLKVALTVLDFGRTTFGASCLGAAKFCLNRSIAHASTRKQFQQTLGSFELVKEKLASMQALVYAIEACTYQTAALIDADRSDFMLETAILKVFSTEALWRIIHDAFQLHGGLAYFTDQPFERMMRDARINLIGEGANDVLRAFIALVGVRDLGLELQGVLQNVQNPFGGLGSLGKFAARKFANLVGGVEIPLRSGQLDGEAGRLAHTIMAVGKAAERLLARYQKEIVDRQYQLGRLADAMIELYVSVCVLRRLDAQLRSHQLSPAQEKHSLASARYYLRTAARRIEQQLADLWNNDDDQTTHLADLLLRGISPT